jgi:NADH-quinone oxidoreductase E subunit
MFTDEMKCEIEGLFEMYGDKRSAVMSALYVAQRERGHVTEADMLEIAGLLDIQPVMVSEIGAFYTMYNVKKPVGKYHIQVCANLSCNLREAERIIAHLERTLHIKVGATTADNKYTLTTVECLGSCGTAPMMQINDDFYEDLTEGKVNTILSKLK